MSKSKKALIVAAVFATVGLFGFIPSLIWAVPSFANDVNDARVHLKESGIGESLVYDSAEVVKKINIESICSNGVRVYIKKSTDEKVKVIKYDKMFDEVNLETNLDNDGVLTLKGKSQFNANIFRSSNLNFKELYNTAIDLIASADRESRIEIYVPNGVDVDVNSRNYTYLNIKNKEVLGENLNFLVTAGKLKLPEFNNLKNLNIKCNSAIELDLRSLMNIEKIDINVSHLRIYSYGNYEVYNVNKVPNEMNVIANEMYVESYIPIAKIVNLNIQNCIKLKMDFNRFNIDSNIKLEYKEDNYSNNKSLEARNRNNEKGEYISLPFDENGKYDGKISDGDEGDFKLNIVGKRLDLRNYNKDRIQNEIGF